MVVSVRGVDLACSLGGEPVAREFYQGPRTGRLVLFYQVEQKSPVPFSSTVVSASELSEYLT